MVKTRISKIVSPPNSDPKPPLMPASGVKDKQAVKIAELRQALVSAGLSSLNVQAEALGLSRSTAHAVLKGKHKGSGLSAQVIKRMLSSRKLPPTVKQVIEEYVTQKVAGAYGHTKKQLQNFQSQLQ